MMKMLFFNHPQLAMRLGCENREAALNLVCFRCDEWIAPTDPAVAQSLISEEGPACIAYHYECHARMVLGSLGHQQGRCSCFGGTDEDPPEMTTREAAKAALAFAQDKWKLSR